MDDRKDAKQSLQLQDVTVGYGKTPILSQIDLQIGAGRILTLVGPNGSGKSTLLKSISGELKPLGGRVLLLERNMGGMSGAEIARALSMVMTTHPKPEYMSCREVVGTGRYPYVGFMGILGQDDWKIVDDCMAAVCANEVADRDFYQVSDGQRQRVMLARALCQEPEVLLLDEPTSYLDLRFKLEILDNIRKLSAERKIAVVMSLHEIDLALKVSDLIACTDGSRITKVAPPEEVLKNGYLQELFGVCKENYNPLTGGLYFASEKRSPEVFVIGGGGSAAPTYYRLQREGRSFAAGILFENDVEMDAAKACAAEVVSVKAFYPITDNEKERAKQLIDGCGEVICCTEEFGPLNEACRELALYARQQGKLTGNIPTFGEG